jgi:hypothetical protein
LVFDAIKRLNRGEKHLKLTCDNAVGQNKNNTTIQFCLYLVICGYYKSVELNSMIAGHTKFKVDGNFGMIKKLYRRSTIYTKEQFEEVVKKSSPAGLNKVQCYENGQGFQYYDFKVLAKYFQKIPNINKYHHFHFSAKNPGIVRVKEFVDSSFAKFNLWKDKDRIAENIKEIRTLVFPILTPPLMEFKRQEYLYQHIRPLVPKEYWDITCSQPVIF